MAICRNLIWLLCVSVVIIQVYGRSITTRGDLRMKRCGVNDVNITWNQSRHSRSPRSTVKQTYWINKTITYDVAVSIFDVLLLDMSEKRVEELVQQAFAEWAPHCGLRFERWTGSGPQAAITISFVRGEHGDAIPFDGPGGILAHADFPNEDGVKIHFDNDEIWVDGETSSFEEEEVNIQSFYPILLHEIGHALGLLHSGDRNSIMYPYSSHVQHLAANDILNMRNLYGITEEVTTSTISEEMPTSTPSEEEPTAIPTEVPTATPSEAAIATPSEVPTATPSEVSTATPSEVPISTTSENYFFTFGDNIYAFPSEHANFSYEDTSSSELDFFRFGD